MEWRSDMRWRLLAFLPPALVMTGMILLAAASLVSALEGSLDRDQPRSVAEHRPETPIRRAIDSHVERRGDESLEEHPAKRATFLF